MGAANAAPFQELEGIENALSGLKSEITALEETARSQGAMTTLRGVGHDILNPVSRMKRILGLLDMNSKHGSQVDPELLASLRSNLKRLSGYAEQLKHIYKARQTEIRASVTVLDVTAEIAALTAELAFDSEAIDRSIRIEVCTGETCGVRISKTALARIVENLVGNAIQAAPDNSTVRISVQGTKETVRVAVSDSGSGIAPEHLDKIFDPGFTTKTNKGTGLGLFVVKELSDQFGGLVSEQSDVPVGATFLIEFPRATIEVNHDIQAALG
jgi:signal transduction histidine kinase